MFLDKKINFKRLIIFISTFILLLLLAIIFFKSLKTENVYIPDQLTGKEIPNFSSKSLLDNPKYDVKTIPMGKYMGSYEIYETYISDHMPVLFSFE